MRRRTLLAGLMACLLAGSVSAAAEAAKPRIMMILWRGETEVEAGFRDQLARNGVDAEIILRNLDRDLSRLPDVLAEARETRPDLVYTWGTGISLGTVGPWNETDPARHLTDLPVVYVMVSAPLRTGIQPPEGAPARPNVTGVSHIAPLASQIGAIQAYLPMERLAILYNPDEANSVANVKELRGLSESMGFTLLEAAVPKDVAGKPDPSAIPRLVAEVAKKGAQVLYIGPDNFIGTYRDALTEAGIRHGIPCFSATELEVRRGEAMFGLVSPYKAVGRLAAEKAIRILVDGDPPSAVPMETLERFSYLIRLPVALELKLYPPLQIIDFAEIIR